MALVHPEGEKPRGDVARVDSGVAGMAGGLMGQASVIPSKKTKSIDKLEEARLASFGTNNSFQNDGTGVMQAAEQYGKSVAFGGQQAQQFFARQYGRPVAPPNSNPNNFGNGPLAMDPVTIAKVVGMASDKKEDKFKTQEFDVNSGISMKGDYSLGVRGVIEREQNLVADYMENRNKPKKNYTAETGKLKKNARMVPDQDYANHPNVIEHNENAARKNP